MPKGKKAEKKTDAPETVVVPEADQVPEAEAEVEIQLSDSDKKEVTKAGTVIMTAKPEEAFGKLSRPQVDLLKRTIAKGASDDELSMFVQVCAGAKLNPFLRQAHLVPRWDSKEGKEVRAIQVGIDGLRSIADRTGAYAGSSDPIYDGEIELEYTAKEGKEEVTKKIKVPEKATVTVTKIVQGIKAEFTATARWNEYYPGKKQGYMWHKMPYLLLGKVAEALALRKGFPAQMSGLYAQEELDNISTEDAEEKKRTEAYNSAVKSIQRITNVADLEKLKNKAMASDKYDEKQKSAMVDLIDSQIEKNKK